MSIFANTNNIKLLFTDKYSKYIPSFINNRFKSRKLSFIRENYSFLISKIPISIKYKLLLISLLSTRFIQHIHSTRYGYFYRFLLGNKDKYSKVLLSDTRDVIFQDNPLKNFNNNSLVLSLESDNVLLGEDELNSVWMRNVFGERILEQFLNKNIACSGVTMGTYNNVMCYLYKMIFYIGYYAERIIFSNANDQPIRNFLFWNNKLSNVEISECGKGPILTMHLLKNDEININDEGLVVDNLGRTIPILHQYDRHPDLNLKVLKNLNV